MLRLDPDGRAVPRLLEIAEAELVPEEPETFADLLSDLLSDRDSVDPGGGYALLRSRPGPGDVTHDDRAWATFLCVAGRAAGVRLEVVHLATDTDVVPLPVDEVGLPRSA